MVMPEIRSCPLSSDRDSGSQGERRQYPGKDFITRSSCCRCAECVMRVGRNDVGTMIHWQETGIPGSRSRSHKLSAEKSMDQSRVPGHENVEGTVHRVVRRLIGEISLVGCWVRKRNRETEKQRLLIGGEGDD